MNSDTEIINKTDLLSLLPEELEELVVGLGEPKYRAKQLFAPMHSGTAPEQISNVGKALKAKLADTCVYSLPIIRKKLVSAIDGTVKYLYGLSDGNSVESVVMKYKHGNTICISTQVGCRMGCAFCASTIGGKIRDLEPSEMLGQIIVAAKDIGERISNVVMMGIGEPLDNYDNVIKFLRLVNHPDGLNIGYRHISLSTCGVVDGINKLATVDIPITLSISLHAANDERRSEIMPINNKWNIASLLQACVSYYKTTGRRISFEYTLISGKNDSEADATELAALLNSYFRPIGAPIHVNLIRVNEVKETGFKKGSNESVNAFAKALEKRGITATVRRKLGSDVNAACGQLRRSNLNKKEEN